MPRIRKQAVADPDAYFAALQDKNTTQPSGKRRSGYYQTDVHPQKEPRRARQPPASRWKQLLAIVIVILLSIGGIYKLFSTFFDFFSATFERIPLDNALILKDIMFGGDPWLIYCMDQNISKGAFPSLKSLRRSATPYAKLGRIACREPMSSGKTIMERFLLPPHAIGFVVANAVKPQPLTIAELTSETIFVKFVKAATKPKISTLTDTSQLKKQCSVLKSNCLLVGQKQKDDNHFKKEFLPKYIDKARLLKVFYVNLNKFQLKFDENNLGDFKKNLSSNNGKFPFQAVCLRNFLNAESSTNIIAAKYFRGNMQSITPFEHFLQFCQSPTSGIENFSIMKQLPHVLKRIPRKRPASTTTTPVTDEQTRDISSENNSFNVFDIEDAEEIEEIWM